MDKDLISRLIEYTEHEINCRKFQAYSTAGRPTKDGGYEQLILGKWYQVSPIDKSPKVKCTCGLDDILKELKNFMKDLTNWEEGFDKKFKELCFDYGERYELYDPDAVRDGIKQFISDLLKEAYEDGLNTDLYEKAKKERDKEWLSCLPGKSPHNNWCQHEDTPELPCDCCVEEYNQAIFEYRENATKKGLIK
jgi:hypothetical protein